jgi:hypothetical protein
MIRCGQIPFRGYHIRRSHMQATCAPGMSSRFIAAVEHDLLESWRPTEQQAPAALGAGPLFFDALL